jgi:hypothetical protein
MQVVMEIKKYSKGIAFYYSLDLFKIYNHNNDAEYSINCINNEGPDFYGGNDYMFYISFPIELNMSCTYYKNTDHSYGNFEKDYEINNGESYFSIQEFEIFRIMFD